MDNVDETQHNADNKPEPRPSNAIQKQPQVEHTKTEPEANTSRPKQPRSGLSIRYRKVRIGWHRAKWHDIVIAFATVVIAGVGIAQVVVYVQMKFIMESSSRQTDRLIGAAGLQAQAAQSFSGSADNINKQIDKTAKEFVRPYIYVTPYDLGIGWQSIEQIWR